MAREYPHCEVVGLDLAPAPVDIEVGAAFVVNQPILNYLTGVTR